MKKPIVITTIVLIVIILATGAAFWRWESLKRAEIAKQNAVEQQENAEQKDQQQGVDMGDWKKYRDEKNRFELSYPEDKVNLVINVDSVKFSIDCNGVDAVDLSSKMKCDLESIMTIGVTKKTIQQIVDDYKSDCQGENCLTYISSQKEFLVDGIRGVELMGSNSEGAGALNYIYVSNNGINYIISFVQLSDLYSKIISTVKFMR